MHTSYSLFPFFFLFFSLCIHVLMYPLIHTVDTLLSERAPDGPPTHYHTHFGAQKVAEIMVTWPNKFNRNRHLVFRLNRMNISRWYPKMNTEII